MQPTLISVASEGGGAHAVDVMRRIADPVARAFRKAIPFLARRRVQLTADEPRLCDIQDLGGSLGSPNFVGQLVVSPGGGRAYLAFDAEAIAFLLDGSLGGDGSKKQTLDERGLSPAQRAFIEQTTNALIYSAKSTFEDKAGLKIKTLPRAPRHESAKSPAVELQFFLESAPDEASDDEDSDEFMFEDSTEDEDADDAPSVTRHGTMMLVIAKSSLIAARVRGKTKKKVDRNVELVMEEVEVDVVAELGRLFMSLGELAAVRVGDTLRVPVAVNGCVDVCVEDIPILKGKPTTSGSQLAISITDIVSSAKGEGPKRAPPTPAAPDMPSVSSAAVHPSVDTHA